MGEAAFTTHVGGGVGLSVPSVGFYAKLLRNCSMNVMTGDIMNGSLSKLRTILVRGLAVVAVVLTYAVSSIGAIGIAGLGLSTPAQAWWYRGGYRRYGGYGYYGGYGAYGYGYAYPRRYWYRRRW
jgi:hypothetical protein